jgi:hypothetical protein
VADGDDALNETERWQARLLGDVETVRAYGTEHGDTYGQVRFEQDRLVATFTEDLEGHRRLLTDLVTHPDRLRIEATAHSRVELEAIWGPIRERLSNDPRRPFQQIGIRDGAVSLLRAPFESLATEIAGAYGDAVAITVGVKPFPPGRFAPSSRSWLLPVATVVWPDLDISIALPSSTVTSGDDLSGQVWFANRGDKTIAFRSGQLTGGVCRDGSRHYAGIFTGATRLIGLGVNLAPGESRSLPVMVGTASWEAGPAYAVPPGRYEVAIGIPFHLEPGTGSTDRQLLVARKQ